MIDPKKKFTEFLDELPDLDNINTLDLTVYVFPLFKQIQSLQSTVLDLYAVVEFYGDKDTWESTSDGLYNGLVLPDWKITGWNDNDWDESDVDKKDHTAGKRARTTIQKHRDLVKGIRDE